MALSDGNNGDYGAAYRDTYESLLMGYAFGVLDRAQSLIVASHLALSPKARAITGACENVAGALLARDCPPADMRPGALERAMMALDGLCGEGPCTGHGCVEFDLPEELGKLPQPVMQTLMTAPTPFEWKALGGGFRSYDLCMGGECASKARFMKLDPGIKTPHHHHGGIEITLVLGGAFMDEGGSYRRGDLIVADETMNHAPKACPEAGCVCMVVTSAPVKFTGLASVLNPFLKT